MSSPHRLVLVVASLALSACCCPLGGSRGSVPWAPSTSPPTVAPPTYGTPPTYAAPPTEPMPPTMPLPSSAPAVPTTFGPPGAPTGLTPPPSFGIEECDRYAQLACACPNDMVRPTICGATAQQFDGWSKVVRRVPSSRRIIANACVQLRQSMARSCPNMAGP